MSFVWPVAETPEYQQHNPQGEYAKSAEPLKDTALDVKNPAAKTPEVTEKSMHEARIQSQIRYKSTPAKKAAAKLGKEYM